LHPSEAPEAFLWDPQGAVLGRAGGWYPTAPNPHPKDRPASRQGKQSPASSSQNPTPEAHVS